jgi:site-specific DNA-cytosine methylase
LATFDKLGYDVATEVLNSRNFGIPQTVNESLLDGL